MTTRRALLDALHAHLGPDHVCAENVTLGGIIVDLVAVNSRGDVHGVLTALVPAEIDRALDAIDDRPRTPISHWWVIAPFDVTVWDSDGGVFWRKGNRVLTTQYAIEDDSDTRAYEWPVADVIAFTRAAVATARDRAGWARHLPAYETDWLQRHPHGQVIGRAAITETAHLRPGARVPDGWALLGTGVNA